MSTTNDTIDTTTSPERPTWLDSKLKSLPRNEFLYAIDSLHFAAGFDGMAYFDEEEELCFECVSCGFSGDEDDTWAVCASNLEMFTRTHLVLDNGGYATFECFFCDREPVEEGDVASEHCCCAIRKCLPCWNADYDRIIPHYKEVMPQFEEWANTWILPRGFTGDDGHTYDSYDANADFYADPAYTETFEWDEKGQLVLFDFVAIKNEKLASKSVGACYWANKFANNVFMKIWVHRWVSGFKDRFYAPGGKGYGTAQNSWQSRF
jgi:hypothetical protein